MIGHDTERAANLVCARGGQPITSTMHSACSTMGPLPTQNSNAGPTNELHLAFEVSRWKRGPGAVRSSLALVKKVFGDMGLYLNSTGLSSFCIAPF